MIFGYSQFQILLPEDKPLRPGAPYILQDTNTYNEFLIWHSTDKSIEKYELLVQYLDSNGSKPENWSLIYSDRSNQWPISGLSKGIVHFKVRAFNKFGTSEWSEESNHIDLDKVLNQHGKILGHVGSIFGGTLSGLALIGVIVFLCALNIIKKNQEKKPILNGDIMTGRETLTKKEFIISFKEKNIQYSSFSWIALT